MRKSLRKFSYIDTGNSATTEVKMKTVRFNEERLNSFLAVVSEQMKDKPQTMNLLSQLLQGAIIAEDVPDTDATQKGE